MRAQFSSLVLASAIAGLATVPQVLATGSADAAEDVASAPSKVVSLTGDTFKDFINEHELVLAEFFAPWCGHCKALAPEYDIAAEELAELGIPLVKVDCTVEKNLCEEHEVPGYPTLKVFKGLDQVKRYRGVRKAPALTSFMRRQALPTVTHVDTAEQLKGFQALDNITVVGFISADDKDSLETFTRVADNLRDSYPFSVTTAAAIADAELDGAKLPSIALYKNFDEGKAVFAGHAFDNDTIHTFIRNAATPLVGEIGQATYNGYMAAGIPLGYIFAETQEERDELAAMLRPVAKQFKGKINLATIDARDAGSFAYTLRLEQKFPAFSIQDTLSSKRYPFDQDKTITEQGISQFIAGVLDGTIQHHVRSQPVPETQDGPVTVVVAHSFDEIVMDDLKDVLVEYYAPWCMHCQALAPKYDELAALVKKAGLDSQVTIAKIDATENDVPVEIASYPTIMLYSAGLKHMPILFEEVREIETLAKFIRENGKHGADALAAAGSSEEQEEAVEIAHTVSATTAATTSDAATITDAATSTVQDSQQDPVITLFVKSAEPSRATEAPAHEEL